MEINRQRLPENGGQSNVYDSLPSGVVRSIADERLTILEANRAFREIAGETENFPICREEEERFREALKKGAESRDVFSLELWLFDRDGGLRWARCDVRADGEFNGFPVFWFVLVDITERKRSQEQLEQKQLEYRMVVEAYVDAVFEYSPDEDQMITRERKEIGGRSFTVKQYVEDMERAGIVHRSDREQVRALLRGETRQAEVRIKYPGQNTYTWVCLQGEPLYSGGRIYKVVGSLRNISEQRAKELELKRLEQDTQIMTASILALFGELIILDLNTEMYYVKKADDSAASVLTMNGPGRFVAESRAYAQKLVHPEDLERFYEFFSVDVMREKIRNGERRFNTEVRRMNGAGRYRWCEMLAVAIPGAEGEDCKVLLTFRDIHDLRRAQQEKREADRRFMMTVSNFYDGIYEYDFKTKKIITWKSAGAIWRRSEVSLDPEENWRRMLERIHPDYRGQVLELFNEGHIYQAFCGDVKELETEVPCRCMGGEYRWLAIQAQRIEAGPDRLGIMAYIKDVDARRREEEEQNSKLKAALELAEKSSHAKSDFLSRMSHDIRTPMNVIVGMSEIAADNLKHPEKVGDCLEKINVSAHFLLNLINDVLDMSKIESGKLKINRLPFELGQVLDDVMVLCADQAGKKNQEFTMHMDTECTGCYYGDALRLKQIMMNLLSNAVKYTPPGGRVSLSVSADSVREELSQLIFTVKDTGEGMSQEFMERMYLPFEQEQDGGGRFFEGTGLGLSITHKLVGMMGGKITVSSRLGEGSEFKVYLPFEPVRRREAAGDGGEDKSRAPQHSPGGAGSCLADSDIRFDGEPILLVEDNILNREIARTMLELAGLTVEEAVDGLEAVNRFAASPAGYYKAVLMDIRMPVMDGLEATRRIRALDRPDAAEVPIIAMTANAFQDEQAQAQAAGISEYLTKPVESARLYRLLHRKLS